MNIFKSIGIILGSFTSTAVTSLEAVENVAKLARNATEQMLDEQKREHELEMQKLDKALKSK